MPLASLNDALGINELVRAETSLEESSVGRNPTTHAGKTLNSTPLKNLKDLSARLHPEGAGDGAQIFEFLGYVLNKEVTVSQELAAFAV